MADHSNIEWTDATWNPIVGCSIVSPGCTNCYAMKMAARIEAMHEGTHRPHVLAGGGPAPRSHYEGTTADSKAGPVWTGKVALAPEHILTQPLRWRRGRRIFVNSMGDLFHESVPDEWIDRVFAVMALCPQHTFQVLTKRSARMRAYVSNPDLHGRVCREVCDMVFDLHLDVVLLAAPQLEAKAPPGQRIHLYHWPLPNVWLGVSVEDQRRADERVPDLLATPAAVRFISAEPLLGSINFRRIAHGDESDLNALKGEIVFTPQHLAIPPKPTAKLDWIIVGGESGPRARPMHPDWARSIRDQCAAAGVPFHFKQWGTWKDGSDFAADAKAVLNDGTICDPTPEALCALDRVRSVPHRHPTMMRRVGKRAAGRLLDGQEHNGLPGGREVV